MTQPRSIVPSCLLAVVSVLLLCGAEPAAPAYPDHTRLLVIRDAEGTETPVQTRADWEVRRAHILAHVQEVMGRLPGGERRVPLDLKVVETIDEPRYVRKKITFATEPGDRVPAWLLVPKGCTGKCAAMLCLHQTIPMGKNEPAGLGGSPNLHYAKELAERGYVALAPDYPNFGEYKVDPYALGYASTTMKAIWNNMRAVDLLCSLDNVADSRIGVIGHSLGGHNAIFTAVFDERLTAVVSSCGFNSFTHYNHGHIPGWAHERYMPRLKTIYNLDLQKIPSDFPELIGALAPRAFFTCSPTRDTNFIVAGARDCIVSAEPVYRLLGRADALQALYPDAEHDFPPAAREQAYEFLNRILILGPVP